MSFTDEFCTDGPAKVKVQVPLLLQMIHITEHSGGGGGGKE